MQNLYENTRYISNVAHKSIIIHTQGGAGAENKAYDLQEPLTIDALSDVYIDSFISNDGTNTEVGTEVFIVGVDEFNIRTVDGIFSKSSFVHAVHPINLLTSDDNPFVDGDRVKITSSGELPGGLNEGIPYFIRDKGPDSFKLSLTSGGTPIPLTSNGTGIIEVFRTDASGNYYNNKLIIPNTTGNAAATTTIAHRATKFHYVGTINPCKLTKLTVTLTKNNSSALDSGNYWITFVIVSKDKNKT